MKNKLTPLQRGLAMALAGIMAAPATTPLLASSHMDAPLITLDHAANTTDVYTFIVVRNGVKYLDVGVAVYPHEEPGVGPNKYGFDQNVLADNIPNPTGTQATAPTASARATSRVRRSVARPSPVVPPASAAK